MKKLKRILKGSAIAILVAVIVFLSAVFLRQDLHFDAPYPNIRHSTDTAVINRGRHIVFSQAHCQDCHSKQNADSLFDLGQEAAFSGGRLLDLGIAKIYTPNITGDSLYGIGRFSDAEIARAIRYGVHPKGEAMLGFMGYQNMSDEDLTAVISYLRTQKPVHEKPPSHEYTFMGKVVKAFLVKPIGPKGPAPKQVIPDSTSEYGKYLVYNTTHCASCHTKRDLAGNFTGPAMAGGNNIEGMWSVNLTPDSSSRIFGWSQDMFISRLRQGRLNPKSPMPWNSFKRMTDVELKAIYKYLQTVPAAKTPTVES